MSEPTKITPILEIEIDDVVNEIKTNWTAFKDKYTLKDFSSYVVEKKLTTLKATSLKGKTKDQYKEIILKGAAGEDVPMPRANKTNDNFAGSLVGILSDIKKEIHKTDINPLLKKWLTSVFNKLLNKLEDDQKIEQMGMMGNILVFALVGLDVFVNLESIPKKIKEFREKREKLKAGQNEQKNTNK